MIIGWIINRLAQSAGFAAWVQHMSVLETMNRLEEYRLFCKANDEPSSLEGFDTYLHVTIKGGY